MPRQGWTKLPGSAERYLSPGGEEVSRRQYDNLRAREGGWRSRAEYEDRMDDATYQWAANKLAEQRGVRRGLARSRMDRIGSPENKELLAAKRSGWGRSKQGRNPKGPMARLLVDMGMRDPSATYAVGDTDGRRTK